ncbi:hypothetical protein RND81_01G199000 [Saponaria officinalis]|uniref:Uncharacterized protein n=1 Tax=Saponaria officinalis TaxID=3572 RepID=A0AAW1N8T2_SAPOF
MDLQYHTTQMFLDLSTLYTALAVAATGQQQQQQHYRSSKHDQIYAILVMLRMKQIVFAYYIIYSGGNEIDKDRNILRQNQRLWQKKSVIWHMKKLCRGS